MKRTKVPFPLFVHNHTQTPSLHRQGPDLLVMHFNTNSNFRVLLLCREREGKAGREIEQKPRKQNENRIDTKMR